MAFEDAFHHPRYRVVKLLGEGGMGEVYLAEDALSPGEPVALKVYPARYHEATLRGEFLTLRKLCHPAIARAFHFGVMRTTEARAFFTMEYVEGAPLHDFAAPLRSGNDSDRSGRLSTLAHLLDEVAGAAGYIHRRGILHLDLKPGNILVVGYGPQSRPQPVIIDFGLVRNVRTPGGPMSVGTLPYAAPELFAGETPTTAADVYSLGATFYTVLSGVHPIEAEDPDSIAQAHHEAQPIPPLQGVPQGLARVIDRALLHDREQRFRDAAEFQHAWHAALRREFPSGPTDASKRRSTQFYEVPFVGRKKELQAAERWLERERNASPVLCLVGGTGEGKSRLLDELGVGIETTGFDALPIRTVEGEDESFVARCVRHVVRLTGSPSDATEESPAEAKAATERVELGIRAVLPLLLEGSFVLIDDLHLAGAEGTLLVDGLAKALKSMDRQGKGGVVVTLDREAPPLSSETTVTLPVGPLSRSECMELDVTLPSEASESVSAQRIEKIKASLYREVGGHPLLYTHRLLEAMTGGKFSLRGSFAEQAKSTVATLASEEFRVALTIACVDRPSTTTELSRLLSVSLTELRPNLRLLSRLGVSRQRDQYVRLIHDSVRDAIVERAGVERARKRHGEIARGMDAGQRPAGALEAAWHYQRADEKAEALERLDRWIVKRSLLSPWLLDRALELLAWSCSLEKLEETRRQAHLEATGDLFESAGRHAECFESRQRLVSTRTTSARGGKKCDSVESPSPDTLRRWRKLGAAAHRTGRTDLALRQLERCVDNIAAQSDPSEVVRVHAELALVQHFRGKSSAALKSAEEGIGVWQSSPPRTRNNDIQSALNLFAIAGQIQIRRLQAPQAIRHLTEGLRLAEKTNVKSNVSVLLNNLALAQHLAGELDEALSTFRRAERMAKELVDANSLFSVRANIAQILAKQGALHSASDLLDELRSSPAVAQSKRLRLSYLYSLGLHQNLLRRDSNDVWKGVTELAEQQDDQFLRDFSTIYHAEENIFTGRLSFAKSLLTELKSKRRRREVLNTLVDSRLAQVEACLGNTRAARALAQKAANEQSPALPPLFKAWNAVFIGTALMEMEDWSGAITHLEDALAAFRQTGVVVGELEALLTLADAHIRAAQHAGEHLTKATELLDAARELPIDDRDDRSVRQLGIRSSLLEARAALGQFVVPPKSPSTAPPLLPALDKIQTLLTRAAGDASLPLDPQLEVQFGVITATMRGIQGTPESLRGALKNLDDALRSSSRRLSATDRSKASARSPWERLGIERLEPRRGGRRQTVAQLDSVRRILHSFSSESDTPLPDALTQTAEELAHVLRAEQVIVQDDNGRVLAVGGAATKDCNARSEARCPLSAQACRGAPGAGTAIIVRGTSSRPLTLNDDDYLRTVTQIVALAIRPADGLSNSAPTPSTPETPTNKADLETAQLSGSRRHTQDLVSILRQLGLIANGRAMLKVVRSIRSLAAADLPIMITGESGTGKDLVARALHQLSPRSTAPYISQSASSIPTELFEADLFGYESGAFTGAENTRTGFLFRAVKGTFHLEEIADLPTSFQKSLLSVIEQRAVRPLGATSRRELDVRFVTSTHRDIDALVQSGEFRRDLFFRLTGGRIHVPPLRQRRDELPSLLHYHWEQLTGVKREFPADVVQAFASHSWPGNVRELTAVLRRLHLEEASELPSVAAVRSVLTEREASRPFSCDLFVDHRFEDLQRALEETYLEHLLESHQGNLEDIAKALNTTTRSIYRRFERLGLKPKDFRNK